MQDRFAKWWSASAVTIAGVLMMMAGGCAEEQALSTDSAVNSRDLGSDQARVNEDAPRPGLDLLDSHDRPLIDARPGDAAPLTFDGPAVDLGHCAAVLPQNIPDPWQIRAPAAGFGGIETKSSGGHTDVFLKSPTNLTRIGARLGWGGTVVFFGLSADPLSNVIDDNDTGRELQVALYDPARHMQGCAYNASCPQGACPSEITYLGWNPVQGGDECGHGAPVLSHGQQGDSLELVIQPIQWNPDWFEATCVKNSCPAQGVPVQVTYTTELRYLSEHVVEVSTQVTSQESFDHLPTGQEWPTMYVSFGNGGDPDLTRLLDAGHNLITIDTPANNNFFRKNFTSPAPWVTWQNAQETYGVGLAMEQGVTSFQGWTGDGVSAPYFHNVRANVSFGLKAGATVRGRSYLALGNFATVKAELEAALNKRPPFGWLDGPADVDTSYSPGASLEVRGWVLDNAALASVTVELDGVQQATIPLSGARPDVCEVYPAYPGCPTVGFKGMVSTVGLAVDCPHLLRVLATDGDGNRSIIGERKLIPEP